jgi:hypothetical protein
MALLDRLRSRPRWQDPDPLTRADAVRQIPSQDQALLSDIARNDADARVRRSALRRLDDPRLLADLVGSEADAEAREEAGDTLLSWAMGESEERAMASLAAVADARRLLQLARSAKLASVRHAALARLDDPRSLVTLAKTAAEPAVRAQALGRLTDAAGILEVALRTDHRDVAMAAVDRVDDVAALQQIARVARHKAACRRALVRLERLRPAPADAPSQPPEIAVADDVAEPAHEEQTEVVAEAAAQPGPTEDTRTLLEPPPVATPEAEAEVAPTAEPEAAQAARSDAAPPPASEAGAQAAPQPEAAAARARSLCERLERLVAKPSLGLKEAEAGLRDARAIEAGALPAPLAQRVKAAKSTLFGRAQELREADEWSRWGNAGAQETLCARVEALAAREDHERVARELRDADARWAEFRHAPKDQADALRQRYQAARAAVKARLDAYFERRASAEAKGLEERNAICARAEALAESTEWVKSAEELKALQARWKEAGPAPHRKAEALWKRFRAACDRFFTRRGENLQQRKTEWAANLTLKEALCARAELLSQSSDWQAAPDEFKRLQAEWKSIGPVRRKKADAVWQRFRAACDVFFERYKNRDALELSARRAEREALCQELEGWIEGPESEDLARRTQALHARWRQAPRLPPEDESALERRYQDARARLISAHGAAFHGSELDPEVVRARKEKLCARVEALAGAEPTTDSAELSGDALARRLMEALAGNTIGGAAQAEAKRRAETEEVEAARAAWSRLGPVPGQQGGELERRFREACERFDRDHPPSPPSPPERGPRRGPRGRPSGARASRTP